ncbi:uroporphyrinogen-III synthase [Devosia sp.]|uniref:uroporphyrinogen-III synthase n=1 Tax=Devosia sp. TaxID=1871048 RepID=UPI003263988D
MSILVTRPEPDATGTVSRLWAMDVDAIAVPLLVRQVLDTALPEAGDFAAMVVTSGNALRTLSERSGVEQYRSLPIFTVGEVTGIEAQTLGFGTVQSAAGGLAELADLLKRSGIAGPVFYPAASERNGDLAALVAPFGLTLVTTPLYRMVPVTRVPESVVAELASGAIEAALFYSRRTAQSFVAAMADRLTAAQRQHLAVLCLSNAVAEPLRAAGYGNAAIARHPNEETMMSLALAFVRERNTP